MNDIDALPMELRAHINAFLLPKELMTFEMINKNAAGQSQSSYYQISRLSWENKFKTHFRERYNELLEENENAVKTLDWKRAFQHEDRFQHSELTFHQRQLFHVLKEDALQTQDLIKALEKLAKEKLSLIDILLLNPIRDRNGLTPTNYAVKQKSRVAKNTFYQIISEYYHQDLKRPDKRENSLLHWTVFLDQPECLQMLIEQGPGIRQKIINGRTLFGRTFFRLACLNGHIQTAIVLLKNGASIHKKDDYLKTPLHLAASKDHVEVAALLIKNGASVHEKDRWGGTPLRLACDNGHIKTAALLLKNGASVNEKYNHGEKPLHWASSHGHTETAALLLKNGADINEKDSEGDTPLYWACRDGRIEPIKFLLKNGADLKVKNNCGESIFDVVDTLWYIDDYQKNDIQNLLEQALEEHQRKETLANDNISLENKEIEQPQTLSIGIVNTNKSIDSNLINSAHAANDVHESPEPNSDKKEEKSSINAFSFFRRNNDQKTMPEQDEKSPERKYKK